jgi:hypothetical protein
MGSVSEIKNNVFSKRGRYTVFKDNLHAKEVIVGDGERKKSYILRPLQDYSLTSRSLLETFAGLFPHQRDLCTTNKLRSLNSLRLPFKYVLYVVKY